MHTQSGRLPDFFIVGAAKSATTSLYAYLRDHSGVFTPFWKEPHFFSYAELAPYRFVPAANLFQYVHLFDRARADQIIGEASTSYLYEYEKTIRRMREVYGDDVKKIKIIISLRNPVDRAFSHYSMYRLYGLEPLGFDEALAAGVFPRLDENLDTDRFGILIDYLQAGMYYEAVKAYMEVFPCVHIVLYDDMRRDPAAVMRDIFHFLGVDETISIAADAPHYNATGAPRFEFFNALLNGLQKALMAKRSRVKKTLMWLTGWFVDWKVVRVQIGRRILDKLQHLRFMNVKKSSMPAASRQRLRELYRPDIVQLQKLINRDLSSWLS